MKEVKKEPMFRFLALLTVASFVGLQAWRTLFNNFAVEVVGLQGEQVGLIQGVREIPGLLALLAIYIMLVLREHKLSTISIILLGAGVALTGWLPSFAGVICTTLIMSFGFHYFETTNQSLTLQYFSRETSPWVFGKLRSYASVANILVGVAIWVMSYWISYRYQYMIFGGVVLLIGVWGLFQHPVNENLVPQRRKMVFRRKYWLYYFLTFMAGARRQIFVAFAVFLLVKKFHYSIQEVTLLFVINNGINYFLTPLIGKAIIRFGERRVLSLEYGSLIFVFIAYAFVEVKWVVGVLYVLDHIFFNFSMAIRTFFQKIGDPRDVAPSMAVGFSMNHIAAVVIPIVGGVLWMIDYRIPFLGGALLSLVSLIAVQAIRVYPGTSQARLEA